MQTVHTRLRRSLTKSIHKEKGQTAGRDVASCVRYPTMQRLTLR